MQRVEVCFNYDTRYLLKGIIVRNDVEEPFQTIIRLDDGRYILGTECQYHIIEEQALCPKCNAKLYRTESGKSGDRQYTYYYCESCDIRVTITEKKKHEQH